MQFVRNLYFLILLITLAVLPASAQSNYQEGYVVTGRGDTLKGYIEINALENAVKWVTFKASLSAEPSRYTPLQITGFHILPASETFVGKILLIDTTPIQTSRLLRAENHPEFLRMNRF
jgi:hypothetical protein